MNKDCQFIDNPLDSQWSIVERILRYLSGTSTLGLLLSHAYSDSDWENDPVYKRSTFGTCIFISPNMISWSFKKHLWLLGQVQKHNIEF